METQKLSRSGVNAFLCAAFVFIASKREIKAVTYKTLQLMLGLQDYKSTYKVVAAAKKDGLLTTKNKTGGYQKKQIVQLTPKAITLLTNWEKRINARPSES